MKAQYQIEIRSDRISTREELFEVMDLLCSSGRSEFTRKAEFGERGAESDAADNSMADRYSPNAGDEIASLTELLVGQFERPN